MAKKKPAQSVVAPPPAPKAAPPAASWRLTRREVLLSAALLALSIAIYAQTVTFDFINLDDPFYVPTNVHVNSGFSMANLWWALTSTTSYYWHPLTWLTHQLDVTLYGVNAGPHHILNFVLHGLNSALLFLTFRRLSGNFWTSLAAGAIFCAHPLRVESVAWVAERKDVLSGFFWILTVLAHGWYARQPSLRRYALTIAALACGLMSKPTVVTLPFVLLLVDFWPLNRWRSEADLWPLLREKVPMIAMAILTAAIVFVGQSQIGATVAVESLPLYFRVYNALLSYLFYVWKFLLPVNLGVFYPFARISPGDPIGAALVLGAITAAGWLWRNRAPYLLAGWLWFLGALVPTIGFVQSGMQAHADRFTYLPLIGLLMMSVWGAAALLRQAPPKAVAAGVVVLTGVLAALSWQQAGYWQNSFTLFEHTIAVTADNDVLHMNVGSLYWKKGDYAAAVSHLAEAVRIEPGNTTARFLLGTNLLAAGRPADAAAQLREAVRRQPNYAAAQRDLGRALAQLGRTEEARQRLMLALRLNPQDMETQRAIAELH